MRPDVRVAPPAASFLEEDSNGWLVTFSDLVLQLFAFVVVAAVLGTGVAGREAAPAERSLAPRLAARPVRSVPDALSLARLDDPRAAAVGDGTLPRRLEPVTPEKGRPAETAAPRPEPPSASATAIVAPVASPPAVTPPPARSLATELESFVAAAGLEDAVHVAVNGGGVILSISDTIGFASGSAELLPDAAPVLAEVRGLVAARPDLVVEVSGHTDDRPLHAGPFRSNLDLSLARAARVAHELAAGEDALTQRIFAGGYGAARPIADNADAEGRARNRRVELRLVPATHDDSEMLPPRVD